jgi:hypothetical protein
VFIDGTSAGWIPLDTVFYTQPGSHPFKVCKEGFSCFEQSLVLSAGDKRELVINLQSIAAPATAAPGAPSVPLPSSPTPSESPSPLPTITQQAPSSSTPWKLTAGWTSVGLGAAALITGIICGALVETKKEEYATGVQQQKIYYELQQISDAGNRYEKIEFAGIVVGAVGLALGSGLLLWHYLTSSSAPAAFEAFFGPNPVQQTLSISGGIPF